jgi:hypothetical protein
MHMMHGPGALPLLVKVQEPHSPATTLGGPMGTAMSNEVCEL